MTTNSHSRGHNNKHNSKHISQSIQRRLFKSFAIVLPVVLLLVSIITSIPIALSVNANDDEELQGLAAIILNYSAEQSNPKKLYKAMQTFELDEGINYILWDKNGQVIDQHSDYAFVPQAAQNDFINTANTLSADAWRVWYVGDERNGNQLAIGQPWRERHLTVISILCEQIILLLIVVPLLLWLLLWVLRRGLKPLHALTDAINQRHPNDLTPIDYQAPSELQALVQALNTLLQQVEELLEKEQRFIADASHELRSPLTAIKVQVELLSLTPHDDDQAHHLHAIQRVTDRATHLIDQLLTLARLDPQQSLEYSQVIDWVSVSENALKSVSLTAREKSVRLKRQINCDNEKDILPLTGEPTLLTLLLRNLLDNAIRYGANHGINSDSDRSEPSSVTVILDENSIVIKDNGRGIAEQDIQRIQQRFFRPAGQSESGSGLGLSIVQRIAELHQLDFSLENDPSGGVMAKLQRSRITTHRKCIRDGTSTN